VLRQKKAINEGADQKSLDMGALRKAFNHDLELRHRDHDRTFGREQQDSGEFYILLFEFIIKYKKDQDLKRKNYLLGVDGSKENPAYLAERNLNKRNFAFDQATAERIRSYFIRESEVE